MLISKRAKNHMVWSGVQFVLGLILSIGSSFSFVFTLLYLRHGVGYTPNSIKFFVLLILIAFYLFLLILGLFLLVLSRLNEISAKLEE